MTDTLAYRTEPVGSTVRLPNIEDTPIGQTSLFSDLAPGAESALLTNRFVVPPFSVLDSRAGYWQERKAQWLALGIQSELGRGAEAIHTDVGYGREGVSKAYQFNSNRLNVGGGPAHRMAAGVGTSRRLKGALPVSGFAGVVNRENYSRREADRRSNLNGASVLPEWAEAGTGNANMAPGTSVFDPVICEIAYRWFCTPGGSVLDPFAGGSVRGVVASLLGHRYTGVDLSPEQVEANRQQADTILAGGDYSPPVWVQGDSAHINRLLTERMQYDLLFSCPPYYDLEVYGNAPGELSAMSSYAEFLRAYRLIISLAAERLKPDRFAVWVIGEVRDRDGFQRGLVADTIKAFADAGLRLYNEAVLVTSVGTLALRAPRAFMSGRTLGRSHQSVLVFWKGDKKPAWKALHDAA